MKIEILGSGCPKCLKLEENAKAAIKEIKQDVELVKVAEIDKILSYGVMMTPALVLDGEIKCSGKVASIEKIIQWINEK